MENQSQNPDSEPVVQPAADATATSAEAASASGGASVAVGVPEFSTMRPVVRESTDASIQRFYDVSVTLTAELGRVKIPLRELVRLGPESVIELDRPVSEPVDLIAQGVRVARGEVVVIDDCFAIQISEIIEPGQGSAVAEPAPAEAPHENA